MSNPTPRTIADLDVSVDVLLAAMAATHSESDRIAYAQDMQLLKHPEWCSTLADYPDWVMPHTETGGAS